MQLPVLTSILTFLLTICECSAILYNNSALNAVKEVCMNELGCFSITDDFRHLLRPINVLPLSRETINTRFLLYTRKNAKDSHLLIASERKTFDVSNLDPKDPVKFIVHGFFDTLNLGPWMMRLKDEFLIHGYYNIIVVDWSGGNKPPYFQATSNSRVVGAEIALLVEAMERYKEIRKENVHIIGHSLGAHIGGYAGARLKTLGRITGCDPAGPYFAGMPPSVRLDPSDADFVDVIHSDTSIIGMGINQNVGHVDFYPNNGRYQPGCETDQFTSIIKDGLVEGVRRFATCNHQRSVDYFHHSINYRKVVPVGYECTEWKNFLDGKCAECGSETEKCAIMGIRAYEYYQNKNSSVQRVFYLKTGTRPHFMLYHYQVTIKLYKPQSSYKDVFGTISLTLFGSRNEELFLVQTEAIDLYMGSQYQYLLTTERELGEIRSVSLKWHSASLNPIQFIKQPNLYVEYISVIPMNTIEKSPRNMRNRVFCEKPDRIITPRTTANFRRENACLKFL